MNPLQSVNPGNTGLRMDSIVKKARQFLESGFEDAGIGLTADIPPGTGAAHGNFDIEQSYTYGYLEFLKPHLL